jgi:FkbM family methyltransferase
MKQALRWVVFAAVFFVAAIMVALVVSQAARNGACRALDRVWRHDGGRGLPIGLARALRPTVPLWVEVEPHVHMRLDPTDFLDHTVLATGAWEPDTSRGLLKQVPAGGVFVDVGAHVGYYSLKAAPLVGPRGRVLAIEPNPETVRRLRANLRESKASVVLVEPVACSDSEDVLTLYAAPHSNTSASSLSQANVALQGPVAATFRVRTRRLDDIVRESGVTRVDVIKIDVEGAELMVLKGAADTLDRYHPVVEVEVIEDQLKNMGASSAEIVAFFRAHGYAPRHTYAEYGNTEFAFKPGQ